MEVFPGESSQAQLIIKFWLARFQSIILHFQKPVARNIYKETLVRAPRQCYTSARHRPLPKPGHSFVSSLIYCLDCNLPNGADGAYLEQVLSVWVSLVTYQEN